MPKLKDGKWVLTEREERFCIEYAKTYNRTEAAVAAGYGKGKNGINRHSAAQMGYKLYNDPVVKARIDEIMTHAADEAGATKFFITSKLKEVVDRALAEVKPIVEFNPESGRFEETGEYRFDSKGANSALSTLAEIQGMKRETRTLDFSGALNIIDDIPKGDDGGC